MVSPRSPSNRDSFGVVDIGKNAPGGVGRHLAGGRKNGGGRTGDGYIRVKAADGDGGGRTVHGGEEAEKEEAGRGHSGGFGRGRRVVKGGGQRYGAGEEQEEEGVEMRVAGAWPIASGASEGRAQEGEGNGGEEGEGVVGTFVGSSRSPRARKAGVPGSARLPPRGSDGKEGSPSSTSPPPSASWTIGEARSRSGLKSRRTRGAVGGGGGDRWIGFAGSPRLRTTDDRVHHNFGGSNARVGDAGGGGAGSDGPTTDLLHTPGSEDGRELVAGAEVAAAGRRGDGENGGREGSKASREETEGTVSLLSR